MWRHVLIGLIAFAVVACVPRATLVQPNVKITVQDQAGAPVANARVLFISASNPHSQLHHRLDLRTDQNGVVRVTKDRELEWIAPFIIHGVPSYFWVWCVEKPGYAPVVQQVGRRELADEYLVTLESSEQDSNCTHEGGNVYVIARAA